MLTVAVGVTAWVAVGASTTGVAVGVGRPANEAAGNDAATEALTGAGTLGDGVALCAWVAGLHPARATVAATMARSFGARTVGPRWMVLAA